MRFVVNRSKWRCGGYKTHDFLSPPDLSTGHGRGLVSLLNDQGYMCCLGFVGTQLGCPERLLFGKGEPCETKHFREGILGRYEPGTPPTDAYDSGEEEMWLNTNLSSEAMAINDDNLSLLDDKEQELIVLFEEYGHELVFEGEYECLPESSAADKPELNREY